MTTTLDTTTTLEQIRQTRSASAASVLQLFDELEPVSLEFMLGRWKGFEIATGHRMDGLLVATGWYGKLFKSPGIRFYSIRLIIKVYTLSIPN